MSRYLYSLVRCVPEPVTGEFVNIAAIAGDPDAGDWAVRQVGSNSRALSLAGPVAGPVLSAVHTFIASVEEQIARIQQPVLDDSGADLPDDNWLAGLHRDYRKVVQLSPPAPVVADSAERALDLVWARQIIDPSQQQHSRDKVIGKLGVAAAVRRSYRHGRIDPQCIRERAQLCVGDSVHATIDFAVANGHAVQMTQAWSFRNERTDAVADQVKAWAFAVSLLRSGIESRLDSDAEDPMPKRISADVDVAIVVARPVTPAQQRAYSEAAQAFDQVRATVYDVDEADQVSARAAELLGPSSGSNELPVR